MAVRGSAKLHAVTAYLRKNGGRILVEALVNFILPFVIYYYAEAPLGPVRALLASSVPPVLWSMAEFARHRRLDAPSLLVLAGIALKRRGEALTAAAASGPAQAEPV